MLGTALMIAARICACVLALRASRRQRVDRASMASGAGSSANGPRPCG